MTTQLHLAGYREETPSGSGAYHSLAIATTRREANMSFESCMQWALTCLNTRLEKGHIANIPEFKKWSVIQEQELGTHYVSPVSLCYPDLVVSVARVVDEGLVVIGRNLALNELEEFMKPSQVETLEMMRYDLVITRS